MPGNGINMQVDQVNALAGNVHDLAGAVNTMASYAADHGGLSEDQFGTLTGGQAAGAAVLGAIDALAKSIGTAVDFLNQANTNMIASAKATKVTDEDAGWGITNAGKRA
ncbi:MAG TPA: hypothetical protein VG317_12190 [Pseudonocardiaceae bacterium]|jgi:hypothetical protein|nr:hypothetical protein [Pseudonocardiaceae bacterium]